ncbi:uncharacterized protein LOC128558388 [Mercenaria mercenaria]|uniref:uncharacterized protein LOC128558388 n=1 Tax=Mercenaria mercenaria TaxID=6596 RepID=UPI00234FAC7C|nr:uncharacterized protein LOC128558388 [Mercenaria mercenaria]
MENNQVPDDTPTDVETPVRQRSPTRNTYMSRLVGIGQSINQSIRRLQFDPDMQQGLAAQLSASFNRASPIRNRETAPVRVRGRGGRVQGGRGRRSQELQIRLVCLRRPERSSSNISYQELREYGLGNASTADERGVCVIPIDWTEESFRQYIEEAFPVLRSTQYEARRSERGGRLVRLETLIPSDLRNVFLAGRDRIRNPPTVFITPLEEIHHRTMDTPTVSHGIFVSYLFLHHYSINILSIKY